MYKSGLGYKQTKKFLTALTESGLLDYNEKAQTFTTTEKGLRFLKIYNEIKTILATVEEEEEEEEEHINN